MSAARLTHVAKELSGYAPWGAPAVLFAGWMAWPALSPTFKQETLGLRPPQLPSVKSKQELMRSSAKYKYVKTEIGEAPTLEEDE
uniref:Uncharacterized protein n=1 Tax=Peronospora matthiolae TaxID=2874970 RepID=A0AAV1U4S6_9STRA